LIEHMVNEMGKRWAEIARRLRNQSDNTVKNWWNGSVNRRKRNVYAARPWNERRRKSSTLFLLNLSARLLRSTSSSAPQFLVLSCKLCFDLLEFLGFESSVLRYFRGSSWCGSPSRRRLASSGLSVDDHRLTLLLPSLAPLFLILLSPPVPTLSNPALLAPPWRNLHHLILVSPVGLPPGPTLSAPPLLAPPVPTLSLPPLLAPPWRNLHHLIPVSCRATASG
jgi:hypothetical protein